uniref:Uncharacterized protein n=1 Tax=Trichobilharzia regenti TaxID=157069 RepID=A0AA85IX77_TRIRE|nr:unnamed protein product [Trichobilharzia regenti]
MSNCIRYLHSLIMIFFLFYCHHYIHSQISKYSMMSDLVVSCVLPKTMSQELRKPLPSYITSLLIDTVLMTLMTVGLVVLFAIEKNISGFFMKNFYMVYIIISVVAILLLLLIFLGTIRSNFYGVRILLWIIVILCCLYEDLLPLNPRTKTGILRTHSSFNRNTHTRIGVYLCQYAKMDNVVVSA